MPTAQLQLEGRARWEALELEPGTLLCLPAGSQGTYLALERTLDVTLAFEPLAAGALIASVLEPLLVRSPEWRRGLPAAPAEGLEVPEPVRAFLADRLLELVGAVRTLDPAADPLAAAWHAAVASTTPGRAP